MASPVEKLLKFFRLESERGYDNRAVVGGLDKILPSWNSEAREANLDPNLIEEVSRRLGDYNSLTVDGRAESLQSLINLLQSILKSSGIFQERADKPRISPNSKPNDPSHQRQSRSQVTVQKPETGSSPKRPPRKEPVQPASTLDLNAPVTVLPGIGHHNAKELADLGIISLLDALYYFPRRYDDYSTFKPISKLVYGETVTIIASIQSINSRALHGGKLQITEAVVADGTGFLRITWFNKPWLSKQLRSGQNIVLSGKIEIYLGRLVMNSPEWESLEQEHLNTNRIVPIYSINAHIRQNYLRKLINQTVHYWAGRVKDPLPEHIRQGANLLDLSTALMQVHFPDTQNSLNLAQIRLAFDEIFYLQLSVLKQKMTWQSGKGAIFETDFAWLESIISGLPYELTRAQIHTLDDIRKDFASGRPMNRLIQGDVGSGKTVVSEIAAAIAVRNDVQVALMAPTSILAEQHYRSFLQFFSNASNPEPVLSENQIRLLVGSTSESEKQEIRAGLADGSIRIIIGTHALIEGPVEFQNLQLVIVDEQHRFGVEQRFALRAKGENPHLLVMTATPIPRSLALTLYGDLDLSVIDEMPIGRLAIETHVLNPLERERCYNLIRTQVQQGRQAFIIYPLVELGDRDEGGAAVEESQRLQNEIFREFRIGLLHGRMRPDEKDQVMTSFRNNEFDILVSTSVVEVGVDVPNATVMLVEGANRFGLAQLHQFRGRVGRSTFQSYCLLIPETEDSVENERLAAMAETNDGFVLAEKDLEQRGPGDFLGTRQAGYMELKMAKLTDIRIIEKAREQAERLFEQDPELTAPEHADLKIAAEMFWNKGKGDIS
jgi:ATP-dependent DNA helicase RecG